MVLNENGEDCSALKAWRGLGIEGMGTPCSNNNTHLRGDDICLFSSVQSLLLNYFSYFVYINCFGCFPPSPKYEESQFCIKYTMLQKDRIIAVFQSYGLSQLELKSSKLIILFHYQYYFLSLQV